MAMRSPFCDLFSSGYYNYMLSLFPRIAGIAWNSLQAETSWKRAGGGKLSLHIQCKCCSVYLSDGGAVEREDLCLHKEVRILNNCQGVGRLKITYCWIFISQCEETAWDMWLTSKLTGDFFGEIHVRHLVLKLLTASHSHLVGVSILCELTGSLFVTENVFSWRNVHFKPALPLAYIQMLTSWCW